MELTKIRAEIDEIDTHLLELLNRRAACALKAGASKAASGADNAVYRPERETQILRRIQKLNAGPLPDESLDTLYREIISACRALEKEPTVAFLGPLGTFSESAVRKHFGHAVTLLPQASIDEVFHETEAGRADQAVAPVENSTGGSIGHTLDLLLATPLAMNGEILLRIHQHLLSAESTLERINCIYSHAQSLAQCHGWLNRHLPQARRISVSSNAQAVQLAATEAGSAAIAGIQAAQRYHLPVIAEKIEDEPNNTTRFIVLGRQETSPSGHDKTSLIMSAPNRTGSLLDLLAPFAQAGVSLTRLESRPARHTLWEYLFFVDVEGHRNDPPLAAALANLAKNASFLKVLGSYPAALHFHSD